MRYETHDFIEKLHQSETLKKSAEAFPEFEVLIDKIEEDLSTNPFICNHPGIEKKRKQLYDLLLKCYDSGHAALVDYIITHLEIESLVYLYVHGLEKEHEPARIRPLPYPSLLNALIHFNRLTHVVDAFILRKIVLQNKFAFNADYHSILEAQLHALTSPLNEAQRILVEAFVDSFFRQGETSNNLGGPLAVVCAKHLGGYSLEKIDSLARTVDSLKVLDNIFGKINSLFFDKKTCLSLLKKLEIELSQAYQAEGVDLSAYASHTTQKDLTGHLAWPRFSTKPESNSTKGASRILNRLLLGWERKYHINEAEHAPVIFAKFIPSHEANKQVASGQLFEEFKYAGNPLHGSHSHRLQWHIVLRAIDEGTLDLGTFTALDLVKNSPPHWPLTFDLYSHALSGNIDYDFHSPHYVHSTLLQSYDEFPALSGCLRKSFFNTIQTISQIQPKEKPLSVEEVIRVCDAFGARLSLPGVEADVLTHYQARNKNLLFVYPSEKPSEQDRAKGCIFYKERKLG